MKALILNSGIGRRMGKLTESAPKALTRLYNGESIFARQIRILHECGVDDFVVTTGPFAHMLEEEARPFVDQGCRFEFVHNPMYETTNYIYSMHLAHAAIEGDDLLVLHGDLVFDRRFVHDFLANPRVSLGAIAMAQQQNKDFKAKVFDGRILMVSVGLDAIACEAFQPFYKLDRSLASAWLWSIGEFVARGETSVYAEEALNAILSDASLWGFDYEGYFISEIDDTMDLERVSRDIAAFDWGDQPVFRMREDGSFELESGLPILDAGMVCTKNVFNAFGMKKPLVVMSSHADAALAEPIISGAPEAVVFDGYSSNPSLEEVRGAVYLFEAQACDSLVSIGGGSAIDVAKAVKAEVSRGCEAAFHGDHVPPFHVAVPTTAGTGSESTHFAVAYEDGVKQSIATPKLLPDCALLAPDYLAGLPGFQKRCTLLDALCQSIESIWSKSSLQISREYAIESIDLILENYESYIEDDPAARLEMMRAANLSGKAINITKTTAAHAMSYGLTSLLGIPHGLAVALCLPGVWEHAIKGLASLSAEAHDKLEGNLAVIALALTKGADSSPTAGLDAYLDILHAIFQELPTFNLDESAIWRLSCGVNAERLENHPVVLNEDEIVRLYEGVFARLHSEGYGASEGGVES